MQDVIGPKVVVNGKKKCNGPLHEGAWLPTSRFYIRTYRRKRQDGSIKETLYYESSCKACTHLKRGWNNNGVVGYVKVTQAVYNVFWEIEGRVGRVEAARQIGISTRNFKYIISKRRTTIRASTLQKAINTLSRLRANNVVRHRKSIKRGAMARGETERKVTTHKSTSFYHPIEDSNTFRKRSARC